MSRDSNGCCSVLKPTKPKHIANKQYVDEIILELTNRIGELEDILFSGTDGLLYTISNGIATCVGLDSGTYDKITVATRYNKCTVGIIGAQAFENNTDLTSITIPETIKTI
jgi:hypothetical protein